MSEICQINLYDWRVSLCLCKYVLGFSCFALFLFRRIRVKRSSNTKCVSHSKSFQYRQRHGSRKHSKWRIVRIMYKGKTMKRGKKIHSGFLISSSANENHEKPLKCNYRINTFLYLFPFTGSHMGVERRRCILFKNI